MTQMTVTSSAGARRAASLPPLTAIVYSDGPAFGRLMARTAKALADAKVACAGLIQHDEPCEGRSRCDMILENIETGARMRISEDRGAEARGCRLNPDALVGAVEEVRATLGPHVEALLLSKFGKSEAEGSGFRPLIAQALEAGVPVIIGVPRLNLANWRAFAEELAHELEAEALVACSDHDLCASLGLARA